MSKKTRRLAAIELIGLSGAVVGALAVYLTAIAAKLGSVSHILGKVTAGVRAIERQTEPMAGNLRTITRNLDEAAQALERKIAP